MKMQMKYTAWLPCMMLALAVPGAATALDERQPQPVLSYLDSDDQLAQERQEARPTHEDAHAQHEETDVEATVQEGDIEAEGTLSADEARREARVETTLALNRSLQRSNIRVQVDGSTAILEGTVDDELHRELAEELAMNVEGIDRVDNELEVDEEYAGPERDPGERTFAQTVEDATTTTAVRSRLLWSRHADGINTEVETRDGVVTLSGTAESDEARQMAESLARNAWGVTSVENEIVVDPQLGQDRADGWTGTDDTVAQQDAATQDQVAGTGQPADVERDRSAQVESDDDNGFGEAISDAWITTKVRSSFLTSRWISGTDISIETNDGIVELSGELDSPAERDLAIEVAENIRGVRNVDARNLTVTG